jgi:hypothetical protein
VRTTTARTNEGNGGHGQMRWVRVWTNKGKDGHRGTRWSAGTGSSKCDSTLGKHPLPALQSQPPPNSGGGSNDSSGDGSSSSRGRGATLPPPLPFFLNFFSNNYMYIQYFNTKKPRVPMVPRVSYSTAQITGLDGYYPPRVTVSAGTGAVWENRTRGIPVRYPSWIARCQHQARQ